MKICIIGHPRTRSSHLMEILSFYHGIPIIGEDLNEHCSKLSDKSWVRTASPDDLPDRYVSNYTNILTKNKRISTGIIRLHPTQISLMPAAGTVFDFNMFNFTQYDKIYITTRNNILEMISSYVVSTTLKKFTYKSQDELYKNIQPITIGARDYYCIKILMYSELILKHLKEYFQKHNIEYTELDYDTIPNYLETHFPNIHTTHVETNYDYESIVTNYIKIPELCEEFKDSIHAAFYQANPQLKENK